MKTCSKCGETKEFTEFNKRSSSKDGYHGSCKVCRAKVNKARYDSASPEKVEERKHKKREYNKNASDEVKERKRLYDKRYFASEAGKVTTAKSVHKRRAQKISTQDGTATSQALEELKSTQNHQCCHCSCSLDFSAKGQVHLDHLIPLSKGGAHTISNVAWSCAHCNLTKSAKMVCEDG